MTLSINGNINPGAGEELRLLQNGRCRSLMRRLFPKACPLVSPCLASLAKESGAKAKADGILPHSRGFQHQGEPFNPLWFICVCFAISSTYLRGNAEQSFDL